MHDNPSIYPTLPSKPIEGDSERWLMEDVDHGPWQTCWEYVLTHRLSESEGAAFWTGASLAAESFASSLRQQIEVLHQRVPSDSPFNAEGRDVCSTCLDGIHASDWPCATLHALGGDA